ncbi:hypothetical protein R1sor_014040 [Riccia sorocarpa]|uniref:Uncharacterized protein n=1 Tax=Riccia sorocarpa TaxID=122646 RepID=A0ABD3HCF0_9MARC
MAAPAFLPPPEVKMEDVDTSPDPCVPTVIPVDGPPDPVSNEFLDLLRKEMDGATHVDAAGNLMGLTENLSATYLSSGSACLDFFFQVVPDTGVRLIGLLDKAWREDALTALKLVMHLRGVRGTGKSDKENFYYAALWLQQEHPKTLLANLAMVAQFGYYKDLLELVLRIVEGPDETHRKMEAKESHKQIRVQGKENGKLWKSIMEARKASTNADTAAKVTTMKRIHDFDKQGNGYYARKGAKAREAKKAGNLKPKEERIAQALAADKISKQKATVLRKERRIELAKRAVKAYTSDPKFQALYLAVAKVFANQLLEDLKAFNDGKPFEISLAAKWAPSLDSSYDLRTLLCYAIACQMFPKESNPDYQALSDQKYGYLVRERLRKEVLAPLRKALDLPEIYMSAQKWGELNYKRVPSVAMKRYKEIFLKHDEERFNKYLEDVKAGKAKIAAGALLPHEVLKSVVEDSDPQAVEVSELQWARMVEDLKTKGSMSNCLAVCDVSGSMDGIPMDVCIALGLLLSELVEEPWKNHVITFSQSPQIHAVKGSTLKERYTSVQNMDWGMNTDFQKVFDLILQMAKKNNLSQEKMVKRLFVFSDMEFDQASANPWETDYQAISRKYAEAKYTPPEVVFWNLRDSGSTPVLKTQPGCALVSGYSKNILKIFLQKDGEINPLLVMKQALEGEEYSKLVIVD